MAIIFDRLVAKSWENRFLFLLVSLLCFLILSPLLKDFIRISFLLDIFLTAVLLASIYAISQKKHHTLIGTILFLPVLVSTWSTYFVKIPSLTLMGSFFGILFFIFTVLSILSFIFRQDKITLDVICGALVIYLLIAVIWALLFRLLESMTPGSFAIAHTLGEESRIIFLYYSLVTITTLGYGDITPVTEVARSFAALEAVIGQIYLVVLVARLVGIHIAQSMSERKS